MSNEDAADYQAQATSTALSLTPDDVEAHSAAHAAFLGGVLAQILRRDT